MWLVCESGFGHQGGGRGGKEYHPNHPYVSHQLRLTFFLISTGVKGVDSIDRLVGTAAAVFDMPICLVSLVDMRRLWFLSNQGLGDLREIPRKDTLCSHAVCNVQDILIVPDCIEDFRFRDLFTVTGEPHLRFYAGACLKSPEGFNIGNFCVLDTKPHPEGLTKVQMKILKDFAATSMKLLEDRRYKQEIEMVKQPILARTAHELMTPLTAINLSLEALKDDDVQSPEIQKEMIDTAAASSELMTNICRKMISTFRSNVPCLPAQSQQNVDKTVRIADLIKNLEQVCINHFVSGSIVCIFWILLGCHLSHNVLLICISFQDHSAYS